MAIHDTNSGTSLIGPWQVGTFGPHLCSIHTKVDSTMALLPDSYCRFILIKRLEMAAASIILVHLLNKKTAIEPIPLMRKKENTVPALFHLLLLVYRKSHRS